MKMINNCVTTLPCFAQLAQKGELYPREKENGISLPSANNGNKKRTQISGAFFV